MNKSEWIWVAIRVFGIYLLVLAIVAIPDAIGNVYALIHLSGSSQDVSELKSFSESLQKAAMANGVTGSCQVVIFLVASYYFLRHGKAIHKVACRENT